MFKLDDNFAAADLSQAIVEAEKNYVIQVNDFLNINVYTNEGERIIDPNFELNVGQGGQSTANRQGNFQYLVQVDGNTKIPVLGLVKVEGMTIQEVETYLEELFDEFYKGSFVKVSYMNKRVIVLGAAGGQIIPLENENVSLVEVVALSGGMTRDSKSQNLRLIRGELTNPEVYFVDLGTVSGMKASILNVEPGDIIYIEPRRRVFFEAGGGQESGLATQGGPGDVYRDDEREPSELEADQCRRTAPGQ